MGNYALRINLNPFRRAPAGHATGSPRPLPKLLKQVEHATQVRGRGVDQVLAELQEHRDATLESDLRSELTWLCNALTRLIKDKTTAHSREVLMAADAVKRSLATAQSR